MAQEKNPQKTVKTYIKSTDLSSGSKHSHLAFIDVRDGKIVRVEADGYEPKEMTVKRRPIFTWVS